MVGITVVSFLRYVLFPALVVYNGYYLGRSLQPPSDSSVSWAIGLMAYELAAVILVAIVLEARYWKATSEAASQGEKMMPLGFSIALFAISGLLCALTPGAMGLISFIRPTILEDEAAAAPLAALFAMTFVASKLFLCAGLMHRCHLYKGYYRGWMPWLALAIASINISIFFGSNRLAILLNALVSVIFLVRYFGWRAMMPTVAVIALFGAIFNVVTSERQYYDSGAPWPVDAADSIQVYTGGPYNVAIGLEVPDMFPEAGNLKVLAYDLARSTIGLNLIAKNWKLSYSNMYFNYRMFLHVDRRSQIMPMVAQSTLFFGPLLSPLLSILFVWVGYALLSKSRAYKWPEISFCLLLVVFRTTFVFGQNTMNMMNFISLYLILPILLIGPVMLVTKMRKTI